MLIICIPHSMNNLLYSDTKNSQRNILKNSHLEEILNNKMGISSGNLKFKMLSIWWLVSHSRTLFVSFSIKLRIAPNSTWNSGIILRMIVLISKNLEIAGPASIIALSSLSSYGTSSWNLIWMSLKLWSYMVDIKWKFCKIASQGRSSSREPKNMLIKSRTCFKVD